MALPPLLEVLERLGAQLHRARAAARVTAAGLGCRGLRAGAAGLRPAQPQVLQLRERRALPRAGRPVTCARIAALESAPSGTVPCKPTLAACPAVMLMSV